MTSIWPSSFDQLLNSPAFPMWLTVAAAGFFALIVLATLLRAEKSVANWRAHGHHLAGRRHRGGVDDAKPGSGRAGRQRSRFDRLRQLCAAGSRLRG